MNNTYYSENYKELGNRRRYIVEKSSNNEFQSRNREANDCIDNNVVYNVIIEGLHAKTLVILDVNDVRSAKYQNYESSNKNQQV